MTAKKKTANAAAEEKLTAKQRRFIEAYNGNATEAAIKAGYSEKTAPFIGAENLKKPQIQEAIQSRESDRQNALIADRQELQEFWTRVMRGKTNETDREDTFSIEERGRMSERLAKSMALFTDRQQIEASVTNAEPMRVVFEYPDNGRLAKE